MNKITKAIIPVGGNGERMYPMTKAFPKEFMPILEENGNMNPSIMYLLKELEEAGIEEIGLVVTSIKQQQFYENFFNCDILGFTKSSIKEKDYIDTLKRIKEKIKYILVKSAKSWTYAIYCSKFFTNDEPVLLLLGDQIYKSRTEKSCIAQALDYFYNDPKLTIAVNEISLEETYKYGILSGKMNLDNKSFAIERFVEKPNIKYCKNNLGTIINNSIKYFNVFGIYILTPSVFEELDKLQDVELTTVLSNVKDKNGANAFIPDGKSFDIGNIENYNNTYINFQKGEEI